MIKKIHKDLCFYFNNSIIFEIENSQWALSHSQQAEILHLLRHSLSLDTPLFKLWLYYNARIIFIIYLSDVKLFHVISKTGAYFFGKNTHWFDFLQYIHTCIWVQSGIFLGMKFITLCTWTTSSIMADSNIPVDHIITISSILFYVFCVTSFLNNWITHFNKKKLHVI